jgi:hypothetical protein
MATREQIDDVRVGRQARETMVVVQERERQKNVVLLLSSIYIGMERADLPQRYVLTRVATSQFRRRDVVVCAPCTKETF